MKIPEDVRAVVGGRDLESIAVHVRYTNWEGKTSERRIIPLSIFYGTLENYHLEEQWLMKVWDVDKWSYRTYALAGVREWLRVPVEGREC